MLLVACASNAPGPSSSSIYSIKNEFIYYKEKPIQLIGANALHVFGGSSQDMSAWKLDIVREFVGNVKETPLTGSTIQDANGAYLHPLQEIVNEHRANGRIIIICPFGWDGTASTQFTGLSPSLASFLPAYLNKLQQWAIQFKDQPDVWIEVWNEPYRYDRSDGYTDNIWTADMNMLVSKIRDAGNQNVVLVPCAEQGQDESVLVNRGVNFIAGKVNILYDVHAYEKWLLTGTIGSRLSQLRKLHLPVFFGELAPLNAGTLMNPKAFLGSAYAKGFSMAAWVWKHDATDPDALLDAAGQPNNSDNNQWGSLFKEVAGRNR
ncbi:MAG: cellulase family glycosylhydrolase [Bacteroidetes bacterium]|nr:cellulase family glycosylhydrolase [Bacteroidota bacterium]